MALIAPRLNVMKRWRGLEPALAPEKKGNSKPRSRTPLRASSPSPRAFWVGLQDHLNRPCADGYVGDLRAVIERVRHAVTVAVRGEMAGIVDIILVAVDLVRLVPPKQLSASSQTPSAPRSSVALAGHARRRRPHRHRRCFLQRAGRARQLSSSDRRCSVKVRLGVVGAGVTGVAPAIKIGVLWSGWRLRGSCRPQSRAHRRRGRCRI